MHHPRPSPSTAVMTEREFLATVTTMRPALSAAALRIVGNEHDAADVVQDSCLRAWRALPGFRGESKVSTWLHAIVVNVALTMLHRRRQHPVDQISELEQAMLTNAHDLADPALATQNRALRDEVLDAVKCLPTPLRDVVVARELRGLTHQEIATELGISETASKVRLHRARLQLRSRLSHRLDDSEVLPLGA